MITLTDLIQNAKSRGLLTNSNNTLTDADLQRFANDELRQYLVPLINSKNQEYFVVEQDYDVLPGVQTYTIPPKALGSTLRSITWSSPEGRQYRLKEIRREEREIYRHSTGHCYYLQGNKIILVPEVKLAATMTVAYIRRPNQMVDVVNSRNIVSVNPVTNTVVVTSSAPWLQPGSKIDVSSVDFPSDLPVDGVVPLSVNGKTLTFSDVSNFNPGDVLTLSGQTALVPIPEELVPLLEERIVLRAYQALGDTDAVQVTLSSVAAMEKSLGELIEQRVTSDPTILINFNSPYRSRQRY